MSPEIKGTTPRGQGFTLRKYSLQWDAVGEVGPIGVPLKADAPLSEIAREIETTGKVSTDTARKWFNH